MPHAEAVAIARGRVLAVGTREELRSHRGLRTEVLGRSDAAIVPGFIDAHLHFLALARRSSETDCSAPGCRSIPEILTRIEKAAADRPAGAWVRAFGYDEFFLEEKRPPSLAEVDAVLPRHPLRLLHRTGHLAVLNSTALQALGLDAASGGKRVERDERGRPTGLVHEPGRLLHDRLPHANPEELAALCAAASVRLLSAGITSFHDPTPGQGWDDVARLQRFVADGAIQQRLRVYGTMDCFARTEQHPPGSSAKEMGRAGRFRLGGVKIVLDEESDAEEFAERLAEADRAEAQVAIHAVEGGPLAHAIAGLRRLGPERVRRRRHRLEHASLCPPALAAEIAEVGATVVTHPGFLFRFGEKYHAEVPPEQRDWLYPIRRYLDLGIPVALGSDAPIDLPSPLAAIQAAVERRTESGNLLGESQAITVSEALSLHTSRAAVAGFDEDRLGRISVGAPADAVLLAADPTAVPVRDISAIPVQATILDGRIAWSA